MSAEKYAGRTIDILAFLNEPVVGKPTQMLQELAYPGESGLVITGIRKLAQRFLIELLTEQGSLIYQPARGSTFMTEARSGTFRTTADVLAAFSSALSDISGNLVREEAEDDPPDEQFASAEVISVSLDNGRVTLVVRVTSEAGSSREVIAAISTVPK